MELLGKRVLRRIPWGCLALAAVFGAWLARPGLVAEAAREGLGRCGAVVVPTLFPFFVLSNLFVRRGYHRYVAALVRPLMGPLFGLSPAAAGPLVLGAVGGYPVGAATVFQLYDRGQLDAREASRALAFCNNAGPGFILGVAGLGLLGSVRLGVVLYAVHLLTAAVVGLLLRRPAAAGRPALPPAGEAEPFPASLVGAVRDAAAAIVQVCAFLVFFSVVLAWLQLLPLWARLPDAAGPLAAGAVELSTGVARLAGLPAGTAMTACAFLLGWGGLCVHCQVLSLRGSRAIGLRPYFCGKLLQGLLSAAAVQLLAGRWLLPLLALAAAGLAGMAARKLPSGNRAVGDV